MKQRLLKPSYGIAAGLIVIFALLPLGLEGQPYWLHVAIYTMWWMYMSQCWAISAQTRMYSFVHTAFLGAGAYTSTILFLNFGITPWLGTFGGVLVAMILAGILGWSGARFRMSPLSFVVLCLAMSFVFVVFAESMTITGHEEGLTIPFFKTDAANWQFLSKETHYYIMLIMLIGLMIVSQFILSSKMGLYFKAIFENERAAAAAGVNVVRYKVMALVISAALIAPAGTFWAQYAKFINPEGLLSVNMNILMVLYSTLGGLHTLWGPPLMALLFTPLGEVVRAYLPSRLYGLEMIIVGVVALFCILYMRWGVVNWFNDWKRERHEAKIIADSSDPET